MVVAHLHFRFIGSMELEDISRQRGDYARSLALRPADCSFIILLHESFLFLFELDEVSGMRRKSSEEEDAGALTVVRRSN